MTTRRMAKAAEAVRETVSSTILFELRDPRVKNVTVLRAEVAPDLRTAKVYVSVMGEPKHQSLCMHGLESARGFIQSKLADRLQTRYTPVLRFVLDPSVQKAAETARLLKLLDAERAATEQGDGTSAAADESVAENDEFGEMSDDDHLADDEFTVESAETGLAAALDPEATTRHSMATPASAVPVLTPSQTTESVATQEADTALRAGTPTKGEASASSSM
jgi:ribosome-binding factor A